VAPELGGPGLLNRMNPPFLRHWQSVKHGEYDHDESSWNLLNLLTEYVEVNNINVGMIQLAQFGMQFCHMIKIWVISLCNVDI